MAGQKCTTEPSIYFHLLQKSLSRERKRLKFSSPYWDPFLHVIFDVRDRSYIVVPAPERVVGHEEDENARPYDAAPVHVARRRAWSSREELEHPEH